MNNLIFTFTPATPLILNGTISRTGGTFYAHLVTALPSRTASLVSDLTLASYTGYGSKPITSSTVEALSGGVVGDEKWLINSTIFPPNTGLTSSAPIVGVVICEQLGGSPAPTDRPIIFQALAINNVPTPLTINPNEALRMDFDTGVGIQQLTNSFSYQSGTFLAANDNRDVVYVQGTHANTRPFIAPTDADFLLYRRTLTPVDSAVVPATFSNNFSNTATTNLWDIWRNETSERVGVLQLLNNTWWEIGDTGASLYLRISAPRANIQGQVYAAQSLPFFNQSGIANTDYVTAISSPFTLTNTGVSTTFANINIPLTNPGFPVKFLILRNLSGMSGIDTVNVRTFGLYGTRFLTPTKLPYNLTHLRLTITGHSGSTPYGIGEIAAYASVGSGTNLIPGSGATVSATDGSATASQAIDGNTLASNGWEFSGSLPQSITIEFSSLTQIREIGITGKGNGTEGVTSFSVEGSSDGGNNYFAINTYTGIASYTASTFTRFVL